MPSSCIEKIGKETARDLVKKTILVRLVEDAIVERYGKPGEAQEMRCPVHLSIGQEAAAVGACHHLNHQDKAFSTHRCHAHYLAKGGDVDRMILEIHGKKGGCLDGRGGSMHLCDDSVGMISSVPIVSSSIPLAVGAALADKIDGNKNVSMTFFGEAATEEGIFHESVNFACLMDLPVIFVLENNQYSVYTPLDQRQPDRPLTDLGKAHDINTVKVDGNDVFAVTEAFEEVVRLAREENKPSLVVMDTYRWREHCGVNYDDHLGYRDPKALDVWKERDPVKVACDAAIEAGYISEPEIEKIKQEINVILAKTFDNAVKAPLPTPDMVGKYVYAA